MTDADLLEFADRIRAHLDISQNHEAGLIPVSTQTFMTELADALKPEPVVEVVLGWVENPRGERFQVKTIYTDGIPSGVELVELE